jgi:hypothetical protein
VSGFGRNDREGKALGSLRSPCEMRGFFAFGSE